MHEPDSLVQAGARRYGRLTTRPASVNPLDEFAGLSRALHWLRLKEWIGFTLVHPDWYSSFIVQDAHYLASSEFYAYDRERQSLHQHAANARGGSLALPAALPGSHCEFRRPGYAITYDFSHGAGPHMIRLDIAARGTAPAITGTLELDPALATAPLSVSSRLPGGRLYTHKAIFPAAGTLQVGDREIAFDPARDAAILDEHKSLLPYRTDWLWGTFAVRAANGLAGANFARRPETPGEQEESCLWAAGACEPLADIAFERQSAGPLAPWHIRSRDGRLDVTFEPEGRKEARHQMGIFAIDYFQLFGRYRGTLRATGQTYPVHGVRGVCESMHARL